MYITYHQQIKKPIEVINTIPHAIICKELQDKLKEWGLFKNDTILTITVFIGFSI